MTKLALTIGIFLALACGTRHAAAADAGRAAPTFNWSGFYVGVNAGGSWSNNSVDYFLFNATETLRPPVSDMKSDSFVAGGHLGYSHQIGSVVLGIESDGAWRHAEANEFVPFPASPDIARFRAEQNWFGTVRPRIGFPIGSFLLYGTAGLAFGNLEYRVRETLPGVASRSGSKSDTQAGWTAGGGVDYGFSGEWSAGLEYLYIDLGSTTVRLPEQTINLLDFPNSSIRFDGTSHVVRAKLAYRFN
jgi:outer membrane immunogenic protein